MTIERRAAVELRASGNHDSPRLAGYAALYDSKSEDLGGFREVIRRGAFSRTLADNAADPVALYSHRPDLILGRKSAGTLTLREDDKGLAFDLLLPNTTTGRDLLVSVERGDVRHCSFGFTVPQGGDSWNVRGAEVVRELRDVTLHEISVVVSPAYSETSVARRAFESRYSPPSHLRRMQMYLATV